MTSSNAVTVVRRPTRFEGLAGTELARPLPASPIVLQGLQQAIVALNRKMDDLALQTRQPLVVRAEPVRTPEARTVEPEPKPDAKVNRSVLLDIFD